MEKARRSGEEENSSNLFPAGAPVLVVEMITAGRASDRDPPIPARPRLDPACRHVGSRASRR